MFLAVAFKFEIILCLTVLIAQLVVVMMSSTWQVEYW
jgi:hypothetical protein